MTGTRTKGVRLECGHTRWFKHGTPTPFAGEEIWCPGCDAYIPVGVPAWIESLGYFPDYDWSCKRKDKWYYGYCLVDGCGYVGKNRDWFKLKPHMEHHHLHVHTTSSLIQTHAIEVPAPLPRNSPPPF